MPHTRQEIIDRADREYELLDHLIAGLSDQDWGLPLGRPEGKDPWTINDALAHVTYWKAGIAQTARGDHLCGRETTFGFQPLHQRLGDSEAGTGCSIQRFGSTG